MQRELQTDHPDLNIDILAINMISVGGTAHENILALDPGLPIVNDMCIEGTAAECSDELDNDSDLLVDNADSIWADWGNVALSAPDTTAYCTENADGPFECGGWRDVFVLDQQNQPIAVYNLTLNNLSDASKYAELKQIFIDAAQQ